MTTQGEPRAARPLRLGLLVDGFEQPAWVRRALEDVQRTECAEVVLVVRDATPPPPKMNRLRIYYRNRRELMYALYSRLDEKKFARPSDPFEETEIASILPGVPVLDVVPRRTKHSDYLPDDAIERILEYDIDVAVRFGFRILRGRVLEIARFGVWSYHHGDNEVNRGGPAGFWEVMEDHAVTGSILQVLTENLDDGQVLYRSYAATNRYSVRKNQHEYFWKSAAFLGRKLRELHADLAAGREPLRCVSPPVAYGARLYTVPGNVEMGKHMVRIAGRFLSHKIRKRIGFEQWTLAYRRSSVSQAVASSAGAGSVPDLTAFRFRTLVPPPDRFWADPFPVFHQGKHFVFFEDFSFHSQRGRISIIEVGEGGKVTSPVPVLEPDFHLSYPFLFEWNGAHYMAPESSATRSVDLYRAVEFPHRWARERTLLSNVTAFDPTLVEAYGRWWMFVGGAVEGASSWDELHLYYADTPFGPWTPHRRNPIVSDVRSARPAGRLFWHGGALYRPAQDSSRTYGYAVNIRRITRLDTDEYAEEPATRLEPRWHAALRATHTVNAVPGLTVIDARVRRRAFFRRGPD